MKLTLTLEEGQHFATLFIDGDALETDWDPTEHLMEMYYKLRLQLRNERPVTQDAVPSGPFAR